MVKQPHKHSYFSIQMRTLLIKVFANILLVPPLLLFYYYIQRYYGVGINYYFIKFTSMGTIQIIITAFSSALFIYLYYKKKMRFKLPNPYEKFYIKDLFLLLLPMTPIMQYIIMNQDILSLYDSLILFVIFIALSLILSLLIPIILGIIASKKIFMIAGLSFSYFLFNMASVSASLNYSWHMAGNNILLLFILVIIFIILFTIYLFDRKFLYMAIVFIFITNSLYFLYYENNTLKISKIYAAKSNISKEKNSKFVSKIYALTKGKILKKHPDIFLLTYDAYVENETMLQYGIDNIEQEKYLAQNGFHIYNGVYSLAAATISTMSRVLDINLFYRSGTTVRNPISGNGAVQNILTENGYETFGIFPNDYFFQKVGQHYTHNYPKLNPPYNVLAKGILTGIFSHSWLYSSPKTFSETKKNVLSSTSHKSKFVYSHEKFPNHSQNSGKALGNEILIYKNKLSIANKQMRKDIDTIMNYSPNAIIIINGDHGPYLTKNCTYLNRNPGYYKIEDVNQLDIQDRYGCFLAIKWPDDARINHNKIKILQDIFPSVFAYLYNDDSMLSSRLEQKIFCSRINLCGVLVEKGVIIGGKDNGKFIFNSID